MADTETPPCWIRMFGTDCCEGDLLRVRGEHLRVVDRTYPPFWAPLITITLPDGTKRSFAKSSVIEVFDPDGQVSRRVMVIPR